MVLYEEHVCRGEELTARINVALDVPVGVRIAWVVLLITADLDLFETPLRENCVCRTQITAENVVPEAQTGCKRVYTLQILLFAQFDIVHDFDDPIIMLVSDCRVAVARNFMVELRDGGRYCVGV